MKRLLYILIISINSCTNSNIEFPEPTNPPVLESIVSLRWVDENPYLNNPTDSYIVGHGIDFYDNDFLGLSSVKNKVIDVDKFIDLDEPNFLINKIEKVNLIKSGYCYSYRGIDKLNFSNNLSESYNISNFIQNNQLPLFINLFDFIEDDKDYMYFRLDMIVPSKIIALSQSSNNYLLDYVTQEFNYDINQLSGEELINKYGTHVLTELIIGNAISFTFATYHSNDIFEKFISASIRYYDLITSLTPHNVAKNAFKDFEKVDILFRSIGSENFIKSDNKGNIRFDYLSWLQNGDSKTLIGVKHFHNKVQLLSNFVGDTTKKYEIENAILNYVD